MRNASIRTAIMALLVVILVALVGCGILEKVSVDNLNKDKVSQTTNDKETGQQSDQSDLGAIPDQSAVAENDNKTTDEKKTTGQAADKIQVVLYFANEAGDKLVAEKRVITREPGIARKVIEELISGPKDDTLQKTIPQGTKLLDIDVDKNGLATVSFSKEIEKHLPMALGEKMTIYSVVNTLTEFPTINKVRFVVEGKEIETLAGHADTSKPYERNPELIMND